MKINQNYKIIIILLILAIIPLGIANSQVGEGNEIYIPFVQMNERGPAGDGEWSMVAGNIERTSYTEEEVTGNLDVEWYRPIEAYIPQNSQIIASNGMLYVSTAKGLYALNAANGQLIWRFDTDLPLGNSPSVVDGVVYVGGYDHKIHALDAYQGTHLWAFEGARAGFDTNPLVVDNVVFAGNRDGFMYAIGAHRTASQGQLLWKYKSGGSIHLSAAYKDGKIIFAASDNHAYALNANNGALVWKSEQLPGLQYQSYWPTIFRDQVIFSVAFGYRKGLNPGTRSVTNSDDVVYDQYRLMEREDLWPELVEGTLLGPEIGPQSWSNGKQVIEASRMTEYLEDNPAIHPDVHKPWRRALVMLEVNTGQEYFFDSDNDGFREFLPAGYWGTGSGNRYPAIVGGDSTLYFGNPYRCCSDAKGIVMGWQPEHPGLLSIIGGLGALAEPQAISIGGDVVYRNLCCDRVGDFFSVNSPGATGTLWSYGDYSLEVDIPGYDPNWTIWPGWPRLQGWYNGGVDSVNAAYHNHGDQNPIVPYNGRLYVHRSNTIIAYGPGSITSALPMIEINEQVQEQATGPSDSEIRALLEEEIQKIVDAGHLRPGYYNVAQFLGRGLEDYFSNPGETIYTLTWAYPYLSSQLQSEVRTYLQREFDDYFTSGMYAHIGWNTGVAREDMTLPPEVEADLINHPPRFQMSGFIWNYPQYNFYGMWKYAQIFPTEVAEVYALAKSKVQVPVPQPPIDEYFDQQPYELNAWIAGYIGFLELQELANMDQTDGQLRSQVSAELDHLLQLRVNTFSKDSYWDSAGDQYHKKHLDIARNFMFIVPELGEYMRQNILSEVLEAVDEYEAVAPYWFVSRYESVIGEGVMSNLYNYNALFSAMALILDYDQTTLARYLDVPSFARGDLYYIQNLILAIESQETSYHIPDNRFMVEIVADHSLANILMP